MLQPAASSASRSENEFANVPTVIVLHTGTAKADLTAIGEVLAEGVRLERQAVPQDVSRRTLRAGFAREEDHKRGAGASQRGERRHSVAVSNDAMRRGNRFPCQQFGPWRPACACHCACKCSLTIPSVWSACRFAAGKPEFKKYTLWFHCNPGSRTTRLRTWLNSKRLADLTRYWP